MTGPVEDGSIMGPFYEIETSSPGAELAPGALIGPYAKGDSYTRVRMNNWFLSCKIYLEQI